MDQLLNKKRLTLKRTGLLTDLSFVGFKCALRGIVVPNFEVLFERNQQFGFGQRLDEHIIHAAALEGQSVFGQRIPRDACRHGREKVADDECHLYEAATPSMTPVKPSEVRIDLTASGPFIRT